MMTTQQTTAQKVADMLENDGTRWTMRDGVSLGQIAKGEGATVERRGDSTRYTFRDSSAIVAEVGGWDIAFPECWCWQGGGHTEACLERQAERG
jgi:hypothetical protein